MKKKFYLLLSMYCLLISFSSLGQTLDNSFGTGGKAGPFVNGFVPSKYDKAMAIDGNGKILIAGSFNSRFAVMRLNADGTTDNNFGVNGLVSVTGPSVAAEAVALQSTGKIILAGYKPSVQGNNIADFEVVRLNSDGSTDNVFGTNGVQIIDISNDDRAFSVMVQSDDKIIIGGYVNSGTNTSDGTTDDFIVLRLAAIGPLDATFNSFGYNIIDFFGQNDMARTLALDANGKILTAGKSRVDAITNWDFSIARLNTNGTLDNSFDGDGKQTISLTTSNDEVKSIAIQTDGKIVLAGLASNGINNDFEIARLNSDGSLDASFDADGKKLIDFNSTQDDAACVLIQQDAKIIVSGNTFNGTNDDVGVLRLNADGSLDNGFGIAGKYQLDFSNGYDLGNCMRFQTDGKLLVGNNAGDNIGLNAGVVRLQLPVSTQCIISGADAVCDGGIAFYNSSALNNRNEWTITGNATFVPGTPNVGTQVQVKAGGGNQNSFTLSLISTSAENVVTTCTKTVTVTTPATITITGTDPVCGNSTNSYFAPANTISYLWESSGSGTIQGSNTLQSVSFQASAGGSYILTLHAYNGCNVIGSKTVTINTNPTCNITGSPNVTAGTTGNTYSAPLGMTGYSWGISGNGTIAGSATSQFVNITAGAAGSFNLTLNVNLNGCSNNCIFPVTVTAPVAACTYSQDFYSKKNNKGCYNGTNVSVTQLMLNAFGALNSVQFGNVINRRFFTLYKTDISNANIFKMLPGFDGALALAVDYVLPYNGAFYDDKTTWSLVPIPTTGMQKGQISNSLLSQLMVLWFNMSNNSSLSTVDLSKDTLVTTAQTSCGSTVPVGSSSKFGLPHNVVMYLNGANGYANSVNGLFQLANDILGGVTGLTASVSATDLSTAVATINNAFSGCRVLTATIAYTGPAAFITSRKVANNQINETALESFEVKAHPNPSSNFFIIETKSNNSKEKIIVQVVDMYGRIIETRNVNANSIVRFGDQYRSGTYFVKIIQGKEHKEIKLIKLPD